MLTGRKAFITGATSGIGREAAFVLGRQHAELYIVGRNAKRLEETAEELGKKNIRVYAKVCDIADADMVKQTAEDAVEKLGGMDILVNSAGIFEPTDLEAPITETWQRHFQINVDGTYNVVNAFLPYLKKNAKSSIVNVASVDAYQGCRGYAAYVASKGAVVSLSKEMALELGAYNIRVNVVAPGITDTNMTHERILENKEKYLTGLVLKRIGRAEDIANAICFLAGDMSDYITGEVIHVNGGMRFQ